MYRGQPLKREHATIMLGAHVRYDATPTPAPPTLQKKVEAAKSFIDRAQRIDLPPDRKENLIAAAPIASCLYGCEVTPIHPNTLNSLRVATLEALMPHHHRRCSELYFTLIAKGHRVDATQAVPYRTLTALRAMLSRRPELADLWADTLRLRRQRPNDFEGPAKRVLHAAEGIGWTLADSGTEVRDAAGDTRDFLQTPAPAWGHHYHDDLQGIETHGIDCTATRALLEKGRLTPQHKGFLRVILTSATYTFRRLAQEHDHIQAWCPWCSTAAHPVVEDERHIFWACPHWEPLRVRHPVARIAAAARAKALPACLTNAGL
eukprot:gene9218-8161_t